jgi:hypothetical protein
MILRKYQRVIFDFLNKFGNTAQITHIPHIRQFPKAHLIATHPQSIHIIQTTHIVPIALHQLRCQIRQCAIDFPLLSDLIGEFCQSEIGDLIIPIIADQNVVRLDVVVDYRFG